MSSQPKDYGTHSIDSEGPSIDVQQRAFAAVARHPHYLEADQHPYCCPTVRLEPKTFVERCKWDADVKQHIADKLESSDLVLILSYFTSDTQPEPLSGYGKTYDFVLHPDTLEIIHTSTGQWRS